VASEVLGAIRRGKSAHKLSMRARVSRVTVAGPPDVLAALEAVRDDLLEAGGVDVLATVPGDALGVTVEVTGEA
jgi:valyl-tRNA synthetase